MSHFTVMVATETGNEDELKAALQPFHEFECTGTKDQYVVFHPADETVKDMEATHQEHLEKYADSTPENFGQFVADWYDYEQRNGVWGRETNPNAKWDWWVVGGRWSGMLGTHCGKSVDSACKSEIDFASKKAKARVEAETEYDKAAAIIAGRDWKSWGTLRDEAETIDAARERYHGQPVVVDLKAEFDSFYADFEDYNLGRSEFVEKKVAASIATFAFVNKDGWHEKGEMGWWACISNEKPEWSGEFETLLANVPDNHFLTVVDCHI